MNGRPDMVEYIGEFMFGVEQLQVHIRVRVGKTYRQFRRHHPVAGSME